jgi:hypothetical protein
MLPTCIRYDSFRKLHNMKHVLTFLVLPLLAASLMLGGCQKDSVTTDLKRVDAEVDTRASDYNFTASLSGSNEVPPNNSIAAGECIVKIAKDESSIYYKLIVSNINNVVASHFHMAPAGQNGGVVAFLYGGPLVEEQNGILAEGAIDADDVIGSIAGDLDALIDAIRAGNIYVNVHTNPGFPGGEVRGQVD